MNRKSHKEKRFLPIILTFILLSLLVTVGLEYLDFRQGKESFIFTDLLRLPPPSRHPDSPAPAFLSSFSDQLLETIFDQQLPVKYRRDDRGIYSLDITLTPRSRDRLLAKIRQLCREQDRRLEFTEILKENGRTLLRYQIQDDGSPSHLLQLIVKDPSPNEESPPSRENDHRGKMALIIDDIGYGSDISMQLKNLNIPVTGSIIPSAQNARDEALRMQKLNLEIMVHIPMESKNNGYQNWDYITTASSADQMGRVLQRAREIIPQARGINNHMGSLLTQDRRAMTAFLSQVKKTGLFFIDSRTSQNSEAYQIARALGIPAARRDVFIDHQQEYGYTRNQLKKLVRLAVDRGRAIGIGHPFPSTFRAIRDSIPYIRDSGVEVVFVSSFFE